MIHNQYHQLIHQKYNKLNLHHFLYIYNNTKHNKLSSLLYTINPHTPNCLTTHETFFWHKLRHKQVETTLPKHTQITFKTLQNT